jgi:hypothetical protein
MIRDAVSGKTLKVLRKVQEGSIRVAIKNFKTILKADNDATHAEPTRQSFLNINPLCLSIFTSAFFPPDLLSRARKTS